MKWRKFFFFFYSLWCGSWLCKHVEKQQHTLSAQHRLHLKIKVNTKLYLSCSFCTSRCYLTSLSCLVKLTGSSWSVTASHYPITSLHPSHWRGRQNTDRGKTDSRLRDTEGGKRNSSPELQLRFQTTRDLLPLHCQHIQVWTQAFWLLIISQARPKLNLWHFAGTPGAIIN